VQKITPKLQLPARNTLSGTASTTKSQKLINSNLGAINLWRPHGRGRGSGSGGRIWTGEGVKPHVDVHTEN